jgi:hypothetical protein
VSTTITKASSKLAITTRYKGADSPEAIEARRDLAAIKIESYVERVVADAPPLTSEQTARITAALGGAR